MCVAGQLNNRLKTLLLLLLTKFDNPVLTAIDHK